MSKRKKPLKPEGTQQWLARIGSRKAMEERQRLRLEGKLNAAMRGIRGLGNIVGKMTGTRKTHPLDCGCPRCRPWLHEDNPKPKEKNK